MPSPPHPPAPLLIALPSGLHVSGVATWAVRLISILASRGRACGLILHAPAGDYAPLDLAPHPRVRLFDLRGLPPLEHAAGNLAPFAPRYADAALTLWRDAGREAPVVLSPNLVGDCYGVAASITPALADRLRVVGWLHNHIPYELHVQRHYEPLISRFVPVSAALESALAAALPSRAADITRLPYGVEVPPLSRREPSSHRPLRLIYAGRFDHAQKRVLALPACSDELASRGIDHELALVGDGPARADLARAAATRPRMRLCDPARPEQVRRALAHADISLLASRHEGLSIAVLESLAAGCVPVITATLSGAGEMIRDGENGALVPVGDDDPTSLGRALASGVERAIPNLAPWSRAAHAQAARFSLDAHADAAASLVDDVALSPSRAWPATRPAAFAGTGGASSGSVPPEGPARLDALLARLPAGRVIVHGTGRHTLELAGAFAAHADRIVAFADDDPVRHGSRLWNWPILDPARVGETGATDVVISSWINQEAILARREVYERQGLSVHRLYELPSPPPGTPRSA